MVRAWRRGRLLFVNRLPVRESLHVYPFLFEAARGEARPHLPLLDGRRGAVAEGLKTAQVKRSPAARGRGGAGSQSTL